MSRSLDRPDRRLSFVTAHMLRAAGWSEIAIANVSATGLMVKSATSPAIGSEVEVRRRGVTIHGIIVWATGTRFGVKSTGPIEVDALLAASELQTNRRRFDRAQPARRAHPRWWAWQQPRDH
jgi:hypothetical protein